MEGKLVRLLQCATLIAVVAFAGSSLAQQKPQDISPEKAKQFLDLMSDPQIKAWLEAKVPAKAEQTSGSSTADVLWTWETATHERFSALVRAVPRLPEEVAKAAGVINSDVNSGRPGTVLAILAVLIAVGLGAERLARRLFDRSLVSSAEGTGGGEASAARASASEFAGLLTFSVASLGLFLAFEWPPLLRKIVVTLLLATIMFRLVRTVIALFLKFGRGAGGTTAADESESLIVMDDASAQVWGRQLSVLMAFLLFGWALVILMPSLGFSVDSTRLVAYLLGLGILGTAIAIVWGRPAAPVSRMKGTLLTLFLVALWIAWVAGTTVLLWIGIYALILRGLLAGTGKAVSALVGPVKPAGGVGVMIDVLAVRGARALVIAAAIIWLVYVSSFSASALAGSQLNERLASALANTVIILLIADLLWQLSKALIAYRMDVAAHAGGNTDEMARAGRLRTLLPIFRNVLAAFIIGVAALTILSGLGVQIGPLIASAGILGVAVGFGAQTLVKDILSGVFYMLDDAFRVGEYIQSGSYKGTVESFSLRSVRLRHHRGPVYTVPFGQLGAVQNMSRDWAIEKMTISVTYDSDVELARKLIKKIGQELANDPEFAADTMEPLKMQGIDNFGEYAIVLKMKMMTKPGTQFVMKRRAYMMIKKAFEENGIKIAFPTVHVEGGQDSAAAAQQVIKMKQNAELAAAEAAKEA